MAKMHEAAGQEDRQWMQHALRLAEKGVGTTSPNPPVGAVIVKNGQALGEGYHEQAGMPHAERRALQDARERGNDVRGATIYVTLEPCSSYGRTPPCTEAICESGIGRVVYGAVDPDERHRGRAEELLRSRGVEVQGGVEEKACRAFLRPWMHAVAHKRPWVQAKIAATLDGRIVRKGERWLSGEEALRVAHQLRLESDAVLVGGQTVRTDDPALTVRRPLREAPACKKQPWRIVLTRDRASLPTNAQLFADKHARRTLVYERVEDLRAFLEELYADYGIVRLLLECGGGLLRTFLEQGLVDEWVQIATPFIGGGDLLLMPGGYLPVERTLSELSVQTCGRDVIIRGIVT